MKLVKVSKLNHGEILAKRIYGAEQGVLLEKGTKLSKKYIQKLRELRIKHVYIKGSEIYSNQQNNSYNNVNVIPDNIKQKAASTVKKSLQKIDISNQTYTSDNLNSVVNPKEILNIIDDIVDEILNSDSLFVKFKDIMSIEDELFFHLTNVTVLSLIMGKSLGYNKERLRLLAIGAFLHDIGKIKVSKKILNKPGKLTNEEYKEVKKHAIYGYKILKSMPGVPDIAARVAYQHHERCDGSGYPKGIKKRFIHEFGRIVAIADVFDAMTNDRTYRDRIKVQEVIEYLYTTISENQLDEELIKKLLDYLAPYPIGTKVKLSIGCEAVVVDVKKDYKLRPIVKISKFKGLDEDVTIDLRKKLHISIEEVLD